MPKQRPRPRRKAAPVDLSENTCIVNDDPEQPTSNQSLPLLHLPNRRRQRRGNSSNNVTIEEQAASRSNATIQDRPLVQNQETNPMPTANDIAISLLNQLHNSGLVLPGNDRNVNAESLTAAFTTTDTRNEQQDIPVTLRPPLASDPNVFNINSFTNRSQQTSSIVEIPSSTGQDITDLGIDNDIMGSTACYMLNNTLPFGYYLTDSMKQKIWEGSYVEFYALFPSFNVDDEDDILYKNERSCLKISRTDKKKELLTMHQWNDAFDIYISIYLLKHPNLSLPLIKYGSNIRLISKQFGFRMAKSYDETFRRVRKLMRFDWAVINDDLWRTASNQQFKHNTAQHAAQSKTRRVESNSPFQRKVQQPSRFPLGYCWTYCSSGVCSNKSCNLKHQCVGCGSLHATITCKDWNSKKSANANKGGSSNCSLVKQTTSCSALPSCEPVINMLLQASISAATRASYTRMLSVYNQFCGSKFPGVNAFPSSVVMIADFIAYLYNKNYQSSTIASYISAISFIHKLNFSDDPTDSFLIKKILKGAQNLRKNVDTRLPITKDILLKLVQALPFIISNDYNRIMLKSMMTLAFYCFLRIGEITIKNNSEQSSVMQISDVVLDEELGQVKGIRVTIKYYKHSDLQPKTISIDKNNSNLICPVSALLQYLSLVTQKNGPLFKFCCGSPVTYSYFTSSLKSLLKFVGLSPQIYKGHSFRIGAATSAAARGVSLSVIQCMGRWRSNAVKNYIRMNNF